MPGVTTAFQTGTHASRPAASAGCILYSCTDHSLIYRSDGTTWITYATLGSTETLGASIMDAAGDLIVGSGADTAARLAIGNAGAVLARINGAVAWNAGTSFPTAAAGDRYFRTDRGIEYYYDGTRWLSVNLYRDSFSVGNNFNSFAASAAVGRMAPWHTTYDLWLIALHTSYFVATTNDGTHNWTVTLAKADAANASTTIVTFTTNADAASTFLTRETAIGALLTPATYKHLRLDANKNSSPGNITIAAALMYRLVG